MIGKGPRGVWRTVLERWLPVLVLLACAACGEAAKKAAPEVPEFCQPQGQLALLSQPEVYEHSTITVHAGAHVFSCDGGDRVAVDVEARVNGPDGRSVPAALKVTSQPYEDDDGGLQIIFSSVPTAGGALVKADLTFDTQDAGLYSVALKFKPELGTLQGNLLAMIDRRGVGPRGVTLPYQCNAFDLWAGMMVCQTADRLIVLRDGVEELVRPAVDGFLVSDAGLWTIHGSLSTKTLTLWSLDGSGVHEAARGQLPQGFATWFPGSGPSLASSGDSLAMLWNSELLLAHAGGATISFSTPFAVPLLPSVTNAIVLRPEGALINSQVFGTLNEPLCVVSFADGGTSCRGDLFPLGADGDVLWSTNTAGEVFALELSPELKLVQHKTLFRQGFPGFTNLGQDVMLFQSSDAALSTLGTPFAVFSPFGISSVVRIPLLADPPVVESYGVWPATPLFGASPRCYWTFDPYSQMLRYIER